MKWYSLMTLGIVFMTASWVRGQTATQPASDTQPPSVEAVFVLDTTGSMSGLIQAAKVKIWSIANTLATTKPAPDIRMGLIGYRDRGDAYVTKQVELTDDLDAVYAQLMGFKAEGGGDTPESVNQALHEAVTRIKWSRDTKTYRVIFLVGDCPPHMDYADDVKYSETCKLAATAGITINTIQCGSHEATMPIWQEIARRAEGQFFRVEQSGSAILVATPFDEELAETSRELDGTRVFYGDADVRAAQADKLALGEAIEEAAPVSAKAQRAIFNSSAAGAANFAFRQELVTEWADGKVKLGEIDEKHLPDELKNMTEAEQKEFLEKRLAQRKALQEKVQSLAKKRQDYIENEMKKAATTQPSLEAGIYDCVKSQAARKGIVYSEGPAL